jgi:hypothetical protein
VADRDTEDTVFVQEMGITHREFFRLLPNALGSADFRVDGGHIILGGDERHIAITLSPEGERRIALLTIPVTHVEIAFHGYTDAEVEDAMRRFDMHFQRGGG